MVSGWNWRAQRHETTNASLPSASAGTGSIAFAAAFELFDFSAAAARYAYGEAAGDLKDLQQNILPLMENSFAGQADTPEAASEQVGDFLRQAGPLVHRMGGPGQPDDIGA